MIATLEKLTNIMSIGIIWAVLHYTKLPMYLYTMWTSDDYYII